MKNILNISLLIFGLLVSVNQLFASCVPREWFTCIPNADGSVTYSSRQTTENWRSVQTETIYLNSNNSPLPSGNVSTTDRSVAPVTVGNNIGTSNNSPSYNYSNTQGFSITGRPTWANTMEWSFQDWVDNPVNYTATFAWNWRTDFLTTNGVTSCESWVGCVGADASLFNQAIDSMNSSVAWARNNATNVDTSTNNILWIPNNQLRTGNVDMDTIPTAIVSIINILLWVAGTVAVVSLIYYAVQMQINSGITGDSSWVDKAKKWMYWSVIGFVVAILAWFIVIRFIEILSGLS